MDTHADNHVTLPDSVDWEKRRRTPVERLLAAVERLTLWLEAPITWLTREHAFNPLYHTGTITVFLLLIVTATGIYLTMFYQFGFEASYAAVSGLESNFIGRLMRALHRYGSGAMVFTALLHGWRTFFQDRFRGARWLAWLSGVGMAAFLWVVGVTGYWLIWDERAALITQSFANLIGGTQVGSALLVRNLYGETAGTGWVFLVLVFTAHVGLTILIGGLFWLHIKRLKRPKLLPPHYWMVVIGGLLVVASVVLPVGMLPAAEASSITGRVPLDWLYLFYLPPALSDFAPLLWGGGLAAVLFVAMLPWVLRGKPLEPVVVNGETCTGCTLCAADCPYTAIEMVPRTDDKRHKYIAQVDPALCVSCGVCVGSCSPMALSLDGKPADALWQAAVSAAAAHGEPVRVVFTCERHLNASSFPPAVHAEDGTRQRVEVVGLTCTGMIHAGLLQTALDAGAAVVQVVGCPPEDCTNREGNLWIEERVNRERKPQLRREYIGAPVTVSSAAPGQMGRVFDVGPPTEQATTYKLPFRGLRWANFIPAVGMLAVALAAQIILMGLPFIPQAAEAGALELVMTHLSGQPIAGVDTGLAPAPGSDAPVRVVISVNGKILLDETYTARGEALIYERLALPVGTHTVMVTLYDRADPTAVQTLHKETVTIAPGEVLRLAYTDSREGGDPLAGRGLYFEQTAGTNASCQICHSLEPGKVLVGPSFAGVATRAADRVPGLTAEEYLRQSILEPDAYVVEGFPSGQMIPNLDEILTDEEIDDLVAFLLTLEEQPQE